MYVWYYIFNQYQNKHCGNIAKFYDIQGIIELDQTSTKRWDTIDVDQ